VMAIPTPGHTRDFMSYWIPEKKILIASEAVGCPDTHGYISTEFLADFDAYCNSMEYLSELDVQTLCPGHWLVLTDQDAKSHFDQSRKQAAVYVDMVETFLRAENGDIERTIERVKASEWDPRPSPKQAQPAYVLNTRTRVKKVRDRMLAAGRI
jgi:glyoxylase-like metal-dependent hydrolase (beta-lactamase superfamily II)